MSFAKGWNVDSFENATIIVKIKTVSKNLLNEL